MAACVLDTHYPQPHKPVCHEAPISPTWPLNAIHQNRKKGIGIRQLWSTHPAPSLCGLVTAMPPGVSPLFLLACWKTEIPRDDFSWSQIWNKGRQLSHWCCGLGGWCPEGGMAHFPEGSLRLHGGRTQPKAAGLSGSEPKSGGQTALNLQNSETSFPLIPAPQGSPPGPFPAPWPVLSYIPPDLEEGRSGLHHPCLWKKGSKYTHGRLTFFKMKLSFICQHLTRREK